MKLKSLISYVISLFVAIAVFVPAQIASADEPVALKRTEKGFVNKSYHADTTHYYKKPGRGSYTSPFDYGAKESIAVEPKSPTGKCNCFTFNGTNSYDPDKQKLTYAWDFGDGQTSDQPIVRHCYDKAGDYTVTLTVTDSSGNLCGDGVATTVVNANFPPTAVAGDDKKACLGDAIGFDASASQASSGNASYVWDFGDGETGEGQKISHTYAKPGTYRIRLTVDDKKGTECSVAQDTTTAVVTERAQVQLADAASTCIHRNVNFNATGSGVSKYTWDFGDGTTWTGGSSANHAYKTSGTFTVRVTAESAGGGDCGVATDSTTVKIFSSPIANAGDNLACCVGKPTSFDGSASSSPDGRALSYHWNFGDGESGDGAKVTHAYSKPGSYRVILTVKDDSGSECSQASDSFVANVNAKPEAIIEVK